MKRNKRVETLATLERERERERGNLKKYKIKKEGQKTYRNIGLLSYFFIYVNN